MTDNPLPHGGKFDSLNTNMMGFNGAVVTNHWLASSVGKAILEQGGNAFDAACAVSFALGVVEPQMSGIGGDGFIMLYEQRHNKLKVINGTGPAPEYSDKIGNKIPMKGIKSSSVPGLVSAVTEMHENFGKLDLKKCIQPAIDLCSNGVPLSTSQYTTLSGESKMSDYDSSMRIWGDDNDQFKKTGDKITNLDLATSLNEIANEGSDAFYRGKIAEKIIKFSNHHDGLLSSEDLNNFQAEIQDPIRTSYRGFTVYEAPPNSSGITLLQQLNIIENFSPSDLIPLTGPAIHLMVEAKRLSFFDREKYLADPKFVDVPVKRLLSKEYAEGLAKKISIKGPKIPEEDLKLSYKPDVVGDTTYFAVLDNEGNAVSQLQSIQTAWGSGLVVKDTGILMNNRMTYWHLDPTHVNYLVPGKRVRHTMNPVMIFSNENLDSKLKLICGTPGADTQVQTNMQVISALIDHKATVSEAVSLPRWTHYQNLTESTAPHSTPEFVSIEDRVDEKAIRYIESLGHSIKKTEAWGGSGSEGMIHVSPSGLISAAVDPRRDGQALVW